MKIVILAWILSAAAVIVPATNLYLNEPSSQEEIVSVAVPSPLIERELRTQYDHSDQEEIHQATLVLFPDILRAEPDIEVAKDLYSDGLGHVWKWGAWRNPDDTLWEPPQQSYATSPPQYLAPSSTAASADPPAYAGSLSAQCGRNYPPDVEKWASVAAQYSWNICEWANIVDCESDGMEWIMNAAGSGACGVMQHLPCQYLGDGAGSIALGFEKYSSRGWQPWTVGGCYPY